MSIFSGFKQITSTVHKMEDGTILTTLYAVDAIGTVWQKEIFDNPKEGKEFNPWMKVPDDGGYLGYED